MQYDELIGRVQSAAALPGSGAATRVTHAVLATLAERLPDGLGRRLFAQLPTDLVAPVGERDITDVNGDAPERFGLPTFIGGVAWRTGTTEETAVEYVSAVLETLDAAVAPELMQKRSDALPHDIGALLPTMRAGDPSN